VRIQKAVITAAGQNQRSLPLQMLIDSDGRDKSVLGIFAEQAAGAGVEEICVVVWPGDEARYADAVRNSPAAIRFVPQNEPLGYGHAIYCARDFVGSDPFLHIVGDHLYVTESGVGSLMAVAEAAQCSVSGVQVTPESQLHRFGAVGGRRMTERPGLYRVDTVIEKPTPTEAEQRLMIPGIRTGFYLCFFGLHILTPTVMDLLGRHLETSADGRASLSAALAELSRHEQYLALEAAGRRYDLGARYGVLIAQMALALAGHDRTLILSELLGLLADREMNRGTAETRS
jgi:UTP--glucose-1-phosphate uridylyltransferase